VAIDSQKNPSEESVSSDIYWETAAELNLYQVGRNGHGRFLSRFKCISEIHTGSATLNLFLDFLISSHILNLHLLHFDALCATLPKSLHYRSLHYMSFHYGGLRHKSPHRSTTNF
jgi:hypothetical protein